MIVAIVGSRRYRPTALIEAVLDRFEALPDGLTVVSGGEPTGVDNTVREVCIRRGYHLCMEDPKDPWGIRHLRDTTHFAEFLPKDGSARAKFARNSEIVRHSEAVIALFRDGPKSPGTSDTVTKALRAGLQVHIHHNGKWA